MFDTIYIARHGFRSNWLGSNWQAVTGLPRDPPLAAYGEAQAKELAEHFQSLPADERPTAIFCSPYYRCLQTATPVSEALNIPIYVEHGISEWYSPVVPGTGLHPRPAEASVLKKFCPSIDPSWQSIWYPSQLGEGVQELHDRINGFLSNFPDEITRQLPSTEHKKILLVSHAATVIALARGLLNDDSLPLRVGCCSLTVLHRRGGDPQNHWEAEKLADGAHMQDGSAREWGFQDIEISAGKVVEDPGVSGTENEVIPFHGPRSELIRQSNL